MANIERQLTEINDKLKRWDEYRSNYWSGKKLNIEANIEPEKMDWKIKQMSWGKKVEIEIDNCRFIRGRMYTARNTKCRIEVCNYYDEIIEHLKTRIDIIDNMDTLKKMKMDTRGDLIEHLEYLETMIQNHAGNRYGYYYCRGDSPSYSDDGEFYKNMYDVEKSRITKVYGVYKINKNILNKI